jgi:predicted RNase H-like nuclease (RuvC/YqgF family)
MQNKPSLIAGTDPGTTVGLALIDLHGHCVLLHSGKEIGLNDIIAKTVKYGRVILVGTDKKSVPDFVDKVAVKLGAKTIRPDHDLTAQEKRELVSGIKTRNTHELDALASAFHALKKNASIVRRIRVFTQKNGREHLFDRMADLVIRQGTGIRLALDMIERPEHEEVKKVVSLKDENVPRRRVMSLYERLARERDCTAGLKEEVKSLRGRLANQQSLTKYLRKKISKLNSDEKHEDQMRFRERQISGLNSQLTAMANQIDGLRTELASHHQLLLQGHDVVYTKKLKNLGSEEYDRKSRFFKFSRNDVLLVENPNIVSERVLRQLAKLKMVVLTRKKISDKISDRLLIPVMKVGGVRHETRHFAAIPAETVEKLRSDKVLLKKLVKDYQSSRRG